MRPACRSLHEVRLGWGARIRTSDAGFKVPSLTAWRHPNVSTVYRDLRLSAGLCYAQLVLSRTLVMKAEKTMGLFSSVTKGNVVLTQQQEKALLEEIRILPYRMITLKSSIQMCESSGIEYSINEDTMTVESEDPLFVRYIDSMEEAEYRRELNSLPR